MPVIVGRASATVTKEHTKLVDRYFRRRCKVQLEDDSSSGTTGAKGVFLVYSSIGSIDRVSSISLNTINLNNYRSKMKNAVLFNRTMYN